MQRALKRIWYAALLAGLAGCAGASAQGAGTAKVGTAAAESKPAATAHVETSGDSSSASGSLEADAKADAPAAGASEPAASVPVATPRDARRVEAGVISRSTLNQVLASGVGRFLQKVRAKAQLERGRFVGWRLEQVIDGGSSQGLRAGDTVLAVNGQGIERPEQFKDVWDKAASRGELIVLTQREGTQRELHYRIVD